MADLPAHEATAVRGLIDECRDRGDDPVCWRRHFAGGLAMLTEGRTSPAPGPGSGVMWQGIVFAGLDGEPAAISYGEPCAPDAVAIGVLWVGPAADRGPDPRYRRVVGYAMGQIAPLVGGRLAAFRTPSPSDLPERTRVVLRCLLDGLSDKEIAGRIGMSVYTVNDHTRRIFTHFRVATRAELIAVWVRRAWPDGFAWAVDPVAATGTARPPPAGRPPRAAAP